MHHESSGHVTDCATWPICYGSRYVVGFSPAAGQSQWLRSASDVDTYQRLRDGVHLGVVIDSQLLLSAQVAAVCRSGYYQLRQLRPLVRSTLAKAVKMLVRHSFRVAWTTATCCSMASPMVWWAGRSLSRMRLHVWCRVHDGTTVRPHHAGATGAALASSSTSGGVQECHSGLPVTVWHGPAYLAADCQLVSDEGRCLLSSATSRTCVVRWTYSNYGDRCFAVAGPRLWNSLPADLRQADVSFEQFKQLPKTFLFGCWDRGALWH